MKLRSNEAQDQVSALTTAYAEEDPRVKSAGRKLEEFQKKATDLEQDIKKLTEQTLPAQEKKMAEDVLAGGTAAVAELSKLRGRKADAEAELSVYRSVIEQAKVGAAEIKKQVTKEFTLRNCRVVSEMLRNLNDDLGSVSEKTEALLKAMGLPYVRAINSYRLGDSLQELADITRKFKEWQEQCEIGIKEIENDQVEL